MKDRDEEDKNKKRKRDAEVRQDENKDKKKTRLEDNRGDKNHRPDASEFQGFQDNLTKKVDQSLFDQTNLDPKKFLPNYFQPKHCH